MAELLVAFTEPTRSSTGDLYWARALGQPMDSRLWEGWIEFTLAGSEDVFRSPRETVQPNRTDLVYWAQGLTATYLEGALGRALRPEPTPRPAPEPSVYVQSSPRETPRGGVALQRKVVLDPFVTYTEGEELLTKQLHALSRDHLQNIVEAYNLSDDPDPDWARTASEDALVQRIVDGVRDRLTGGS